MVLPVVVKVEAVQVVVVAPSVVMAVTAVVVPTASRAPGGMPSVVKRVVSVVNAQPAALMTARVRLTIVRVALTINRVTLVTAASVAISHARGVIADQTTGPVTALVPVNPLLIKSRGATNLGVTAHEAISREPINPRVNHLASRQGRPLPSRVRSLAVKSSASTAARVVMAVLVAEAAKSLFVSCC